MRFMENFISTYNVSPEAARLLSHGIEILRVWQDKLNLISAHSLKDVWTRHVADSYQLYQYLNIDTKTVYDIGSGAGFPAIVLAIAAQTDKRPTKFKLIESITKKTVYLNDVRNKLGLKNVEIINDRAENLHIKPADIITARAVANLNKLLGLAYPLTNLNTVLILPKGQGYALEVDEAKQNWHFDIKVLQNEVESQGVVLILSNLRKKR